VTIKSVGKHAVARLMPSRQKLGVRILLYHAIDAPDGSDHLGLKVSPTLFREQMLHLQTEGYQVVPLKSLLNALNVNDKKQVVITFDDGYQSVANATEVLSEFGFPATIFATVGWIDRSSSGSNYWNQWPSLTWAELRACMNQGLEIGAHSVSHPCLPTCSDSELAYELNDAKVLLEQQLGSGITSFSYPHGLYDDRVKRFVSAAGFRLGCTSVCGVNRHPYGSLELHRTEISGADDMAIFRRKLAGQYDWMGPWQRRQARKS